MQVVTTYLQTNGIVAGLNINWPNSLRSIQNIFNVVQSSMVNTVSMDCSLQYWDTPILSQAGFEAVLAMLVPMGMLAIFCLGWTLRSLPAPLPSLSGLTPACTRGALLAATPSASCDPLGPQIGPAAVSLPIPLPNWV